jgi:hypothetical protein
MAEPVVLNPEENEFDGDRVVPRVSKLQTIEQVHVEAAKLYKSARHGKVSAADANRLVPLLTLVLSILRQTDIDRRLGELEKRLLRANRTGARTTFKPKLVPPPPVDDDEDAAG